MGAAAGGGDQQTAPPRVRVPRREPAPAEPRRPAAGSPPGEPGPEPAARGRPRWQQGLIFWVLLSALLGAPGCVVAPYAGGCLPVLFAVVPDDRLAVRLAPPVAEAPGLPVLAQRLPPAEPASGRTAATRTGFGVWAARPAGGWSARPAARGSTAGRA